MKIGEIINKTKQYFAERGMESPRLDAEILLCHILNKDRLYLYVHFDQPLEKHEIDSYRDFVVRRVKGEPVAYITGSKNFLNMSFYVDKRVLVPRPETELLAERAIKYCSGRDAAILDIGTGSGALALSILRNTENTKVVALDISQDALCVAQKNAEKYDLCERVDFIHSDMKEYLAKEPESKFALIVSNPPYITAEEMKGLPHEVQKEPKEALYGGEDGLDFYKVIIKNAVNFLLPGAPILLEIGSLQAKAVLLLGQQAGFTNRGVIKDYAGLDRIVFLAGDGFDGNSVFAC